MSDTFQIAGRTVGQGYPAFVIAELSANHDQDISKALRLIDEAAAAGVDAVKLQTYTADAMTLDLDLPIFRIGPGSPWAGRTLYDLYEEAATPSAWYSQLAAAAQGHGLVLFSTPFDRPSVDFLVAEGAPALKIASFELLDLPLIRHAAATGLPLIMSTGMATATEIDEAVRAALDSGSGGVALLRCNSAYPSEAKEMDLRSITDMAGRWGLPIGLSDHTLGLTAASVAIALGACIVEKHLTLSRSDPGPDSSFSLEPDEFRDLVSTVREVEAALGTTRYGPSPSEQSSLAFRRSLFVVDDVAAGEPFSEANLRSIRPAGGVAPKHLVEVVGKRARRDVTAGTPLTWDLVDE